jgi:CheY-like chemotaxis protein
MTVDVVKELKNPILVVEDHPVNQQIVTMSLKRLGYTNVELAVNGIEAVDKTSKQKYDLILMDCQMPEMDGFQATIKIRDAEKATNAKRTPIVAITADIIKSDRNKCINHGMEDYLNKPLNIVTLREVITKHMIQSGAQNISEL